MSREFARSSLVSIWAGSARNDTTAKATPRGNRASRTTCASRDLRRVPTARALRIEGSYTTKGYSVRERSETARPELEGLGPRRSRTLRCHRDFHTPLTVYSQADVRVALSYSIWRMC